MKKRIIITNIIVLLIALVSCLGVSLYISRRNVVSNAIKQVKNYANVAKDVYSSGKGVTETIGKFEGVEENMRLTFIRVNLDESVTIYGDSKYGDNYDLIAKEDWLELPEFSYTEQEFDEGKQLHIIRVDKTENKRMIFYVTACDVEYFTVYIRVGLQYDTLFDDNTSLLVFTIIFSTIVFVIMAIVIGQSTVSGLKPINKVISSLEGLTTSEKKEYNFSNIEDISEKISDIRDELAKNIMRVNNEKNKVEIILENMGQGLIALNENNNIILVNKYAQNVLFNGADVNEKNLEEINIDNALKQQIKMVCEEKGHLMYDKKIGESYYTLSINSISNIWGNGESRRIIIVVTDVTDEKIGEMRQKEFFNNASHELRSPLTSIVGFQELICEGFVEGNDIIDLCKRSLTEGKRMQNLINDMLDLASLEKEEKGEIVRINLAEMVGEIVASLEPQLLIDNLTCISNIDDSYVIANQRHIYQLMRNLIDNAIKYNVINGKIYINIKSEKNNVDIEIKDTGVGISSADQSQIFERFYRVDKARSRKLGSSGLGLSIVRQICNIYAASISIESKLKEGTTIDIKFPKMKQ